MRLLFIALALWAICSAPIAGHAQTSISGSLDITSTGWSTATINWTQVGLRVSHDTVEITDLAKIHFVKIGDKVYEVVRPEPFLQEKPKGFFFGTPLCPSGVITPTSSIHTFAN